MENPFRVRNLIEISASNIRTILGYLRVKYKTESEYERRVRKYEPEV